MNVLRPVPSRRGVEAPRCVGAILLVALLLPCGALRAQGDDSVARPDFLFVRYASRTSMSLYGGYGRAGALLVFGVVENPRSGYRELIAGPAVAVDLGGGLTTVLAGAVASASDSWYAQAYVIPAFSWRRWSVYGSVESYTPLQARGAWQLDVNPLLAMVRAVGRVQVGASWVDYAQTGVGSTQEIGPAAQFLIPGGRVTIELLRRLHSGAGDLRLTFQDAL